MLTPRVRGCRSVPVVAHNHGKRVSGCSQPRFLVKVVAYNRVFFAKVVAPNMMSLAKELTFVPNILLG
ncbi:hypothetical protein [Runella sp. SP2]|uniref:hypothetical protein n=1 Tax=Runella sp. SP2 TaxID=2268026 RepID=UPI000F099336|nr:hypothetical protein [Runella sp. SP2]AYQ34588.1 hypothetical protein DTQ70_21550 [Runella sp. SP2]